MLDSRPQLTPGQSAAAMPRPLRADAVRNLARIMTAAEAGFGNVGLDASIDDVAERAGVGKATIYRSFATKEHLVSAVACKRLLAFQGLAQAALGEPDAWTAFSGLLIVVAETHAEDRILGSALESRGQLPDLCAARRATLAAIEQLIRKARRQGGVRSDATAHDVRVMFGGATQVLIAAGEDDPAVWRRYSGFIVDALRSREP